MPANVAKSYSAAATGAQKSLAAPGGVAFIRYALQVKGVAVAASSWSVTLEGSLDGANWTTLLTHTTPDGATLWESTGKACLFVRANVGALVLGSATSITVTAVAASDD